jgi:hypothetical protein
LVTEANQNSGQQQSGQSSSNSGSQQQSQASGAQDGASGQQQNQNSGQQQQSQGAAQRPAYVREKFFDAATNQVKEKEYNDYISGLEARAAEQDVRKNTLPKTADGYEVRLPANFTPPEGMTFEFDKNDPGLKRAREIALARGIDQETFQDMLGVYAGNKIGELQQTNELVKQNRDKLGSAADARLTAIDTWFTAKVGEKAKPMMAALKQYPVVETVEAYEAIIRQFSNQGGADFDQRHRTEKDQNEIPGYENMTFEQRRLHQMQQQEQRRAAGGGR